MLIILVTCPIQNLVVLDLKMLQENSKFLTRQCPVSVSVNGHCERLFAFTIVYFSRGNNNSSHLNNVKYSQSRFANAARTLYLLTTIYYGCNKFHRSQIYFRLSELYSLISRDISSSHTIYPKISSIVILVGKPKFPKIGPRLYIYIQIYSTTFLVDFDRKSAKNGVFHTSSVRTSICTCTLCTRMSVHTCDDRGAYM